jgi:hypothetical protein
MQNLAEKLTLQQTVEEPALADNGHPMILDVVAPIIFEKNSTNFETFCHECSQPS